VDYWSATQAYALAKWSEHSFAAYLLVKRRLGVLALP